MKHFIFFILLLVLAASLTASCTDSASSRRVVGEWRLITIRGGFIGGTFDAKSLGISERIVISTDGVVTVHDGDRVTYSGRYDDFISSNTLGNIEPHGTNYLVIGSLSTPDGEERIYHRVLSSYPLDMPMEQDWLP